MVWLRLTEAETSYHRARIDYAIALKNVHFEKGSLLEYNGAILADHGLGGHDIRPAGGQVCQVAVSADEMCVDHGRF